MLFQKPLAHLAIYADFTLSAIVKSKVGDVVVSYFRIGQFHNIVLSFVAICWWKLQKSLIFGIITAFLTTATHHFATNEPQSCIVGGETTLYTLTLDYLWNLTRLVIHRHG